MFEFERAVAEKEDEEAMYHFIGYMPVRGRLYELDGCNPGPIDHGTSLERFNLLHMFFFLFLFSFSVLRWPSNAPHSVRLEID